MNNTLLIKIAREAILSRFNGDKMDVSEYVSRYPELSQNQSTFVTITIDGVLRGCIGSIIAYRPLIDDLISNAEAAAFHDPRFPPLSREEYSQLKIEISLLTEPQMVEYTDTASLRQKIVAGIDGIILKYGNHQATFLPQVWQQLPEFEMFFSHLGLKAGLGNNPLSYHPDVYVYHVEKIEE